MRTDTHIGHWVFTPVIQRLIEQKTIPFYIRNLHESSDRSLQAYARCTGRTVPVDRCTSTPKDGELIVCVVKRSRLTQISIHPRFLVPWEPVVGGEVVVIKGECLGTQGVVKAREHPRSVVNFTFENDSWDVKFDDSDLATIEPLRGSYLICIC